MDDASANSNAAMNEEDDEYEIDFNDPSLRTIAPKAWRRRERDLAKIREKARTSAKEDVRKFVSGAHETLGVRGKSEDEYDDAIIERVEASPRRRRPKRGLDSRRPPVKANLETMRSAF